MTDRAPRRAVPGRPHFLVCALGWTTFAIYGSLVPLRYSPTSFAAAVERFENLPALWVGIGTRADWVANILLFIPLTFFWMGALACDRGKRTRGAAGVILFILAAVASVALEFTQIWFPGRTVSRNDIVAETLGGAIGVIAWLVIGQRSASWLRGYTGDRSQPSQLKWLLQAYLIGFAIFSVLPLDLTVSLTELYHKYERGQMVLVPFAHQYESLAELVYQSFGDVMVFVPVGALLALNERERRRGWPPLLTGAIGGGLIAVALEFAQLLVLSRYTDATDIVLGTIGATIGAWLVVLSATRPAGHAAVGNTRSPFARSVPWLAGIAGYSIFLIVGFWFPFEITRNRALISARVDGFFRVPFFALYQGTEFNALDQLLIRLLLFAPLGVMWAYVANLAKTAAVRRTIGLFGLFYAATLAFGIEAGQVLMPSKVADSTEVLLCALGAFGGLYAMLRLLGPKHHNTGRMP